MEIFKDKSGKISSKRCSGIFIAAIAVMMSLITFIANVGYGQNDLTIAVSIIGILFAKSATVLGMGTFEKKF